jgi:FtsP/CotA-like multicopper oxidase with cupredoxin domain
LTAYSEYSINDSWRHIVELDTTRRAFLAASGLTAGLAATGRADAISAATTEVQFPRYQPGPGGPIGSPTDRGKLVSGLRAAGLPPVPIVTPDLPQKLPWKMVDGFKEFHLVAQHLKREFLPGQWFDVWCYNGSLPGPTIEAVEGDRIRIVVHNELPESTTLHLHGLELPNRFDGVHGITQNPIKPGTSFAYELTLHQVGTFFYHSHGPMQEGLGMTGLFIIHPRTAYEPVVDHDFALLIQEWAILPQATVPNVTSMEFNWFTLNGRSAPYITPMVVRLGSRVRIRFVNMSSIDHHPMHLHGHTFWVTGTEGGRIPESAWVPGNNVLVGVAQAREIEFIANNPGDWVMHCHMFHHMMNHMTVMVGPMGGHTRMGMPMGNNMQSGMGMTQGGPALSSENGPSLGRGMGEQQSNERAVRTGQHDASHGEMSQPRVPGFPADMMDMMGMQSPAAMRKLNKPETRGMRRDWFTGIEALMTVVRVLPAELYDKVVSGKGDVQPGASVPGGGPGRMPGMMHGEMPDTKKGTPAPKGAGEHEHKH